MKIKFLKDFEARTAANGVQLIVAGRVVELEEYKASRLIDAGVAKPVDVVPRFNSKSRPYIDIQGRLVIPGDCPRKYRYWSGGQSVRDTMKEISKERSSESL